MERIEISLAKIKKYGKNFEIVVNPDKAIECKKGLCPVEDVLNSPEIFSDAQKGMHAADSDLEMAFQTTDAKEIAKKILKDGEIQLSAEYRKKLRENKRKKIINLIHKNCIDPRTKAPLPPTRIENALEDAKIKIDEIRSADEQFEKIIEKLKTYMPIRVEKSILLMTIPAHYSGKVYGVVKTMGKLLNENWSAQGEFLAKIEIPAGIEFEVIERINKLTDGNARIEKEEK